MLRGGIVGLAALFVFAGVSCRQKSDAEVGATVQVLDASKLRPSFTGASADLKGMVETVMTSIQSSDYRTALANLEKLSQAASLTDEQKKVVNDVKEQVQRKQAAIAPPSN